MDHITLLWGVDETGSTWAGGSSAEIANITVANSIIAEGMHKTVLATSRTAKGYITGAAPSGPQPQSIAYIGNLFAHNFERNPFTTSAVVANNLVYNWQYQAMEIRAANGSSGTAQGSFVGNVFKAGPITNEGRLPISLLDLDNASEIYVSDNVTNYIAVTDQYDDLVSARGSTVKANVEAGTAPIWPEGFTAAAGSTVEASVVAGAGSFPNSRDATSQRIIDDVSAETGALKGCVENCGNVGVDGSIQVPGGWPTIAVNTRTFDAPASPNADDDADGYTNLEECLHGWAAVVETGASTPSCD